MALSRLCFLLAAVSLLAGLITGCGGSSNYAAVPSARSADLTPTAASAWDSESGLRIGTSADFPPANFINERGEIDGFERELGDELCRRMELECEWVRNDWVSIIPSLLSGEYDIILSGMAATKERDEQIDFTQAYNPGTPSAYVALAGSDEDVINGRVAVQANTIQQDYLRDEGITRVIFLAGEDPVEAVRIGEADAVFANKNLLNSFVEDSGGGLEFVGPEVSFESQDASIGVRENDGELKRRLNAALGTMKDDGSLNDLITKWFGADAVTF